ncbi:MAG: P1 family peptidase [Thermoplasmata archaeon]
MVRAVPSRAAPNRTVTGVPGVRVGVTSDEKLESGVSVVRFEEPVPVVAMVRGPASGTYDTHSLGLDATFGRRQALFLAGGSVYGLDAARGVRTRLLADGQVAGALGNPFPLPRLAGAILYDLPSRPGPIPDYLPLGFEAAGQASRDPLPHGRVGAGRGSRVGKYRGVDRSMPGGQASVSLPIERSFRIGLLTVFNSVGAIRDPRTGRWLAGARDRHGRIEPPSATRGQPRVPAGAGTNLGILVTNLPVERRVLYALAGHVHDGFARVVAPAHTATEGDTVFAACTADPDQSPRLEARPGLWADRLGFLAEEMVAQTARLLFPGGSATE